MKTLIFSLLFLANAIYLLAEAPPALKKGDTIAIIAPASTPEEDLSTINKGVKLLEQKGYKVKVSPTLTRRHGYLAGTDEERVKAFMDAWLDPQVKAVWCYRGGYGVTRILDRLDYKAIKERPKILIGMSDITALHAAIQKETGLITFLGPNFNAVFIKDEDKSGYNEKELWNMIAKETFPKGGIVFRNPKSFPNRVQQSWTLNAGKVQGKLVGGTLCLVSSLIGTPWEIDLRGKILVLEEIDEEPYRIDRMLSHMKNSGRLDQLGGVILCSWTGCNSNKPGKSLTLDQVFKDYFEGASYPVLVGFPSGHITEQATLPLNALAELDATAKTLRLLEAPVKIPSHHKK